MSDEKNTEFDPLGWYPDANPFEHAGVHAARLFMSDNPLIKDLAEQLGGALNNLRAAGKNPDEVAKAAYWVGLISGYLAQEEYYPSKERLKAAKAYEVRCGQKLALLQRNNNDEVLKGRAVRSIAEEYALRLLIDDYLGGERALRRVSEFLCNRLMSDTVAPNRRHHEQDETPHHRRTAGSAPGQLPET